MKKQHIYRLINKINSFPSIPAVVSKILEVTSDDDASIDELLNIIILDQTFAVLLLKAANSAFYGRVRGVGSLKEAISVLGQKEIRNIIVSKAVFNRFKDTNNPGLIDINQFWEHSFYCGLFAKIIAEKLGKDGSDFFIAGLIHDIGKLIIYFQLPEEFKKIFDASNKKLSDTYLYELKILGTTHDRIGAMLLKKWLFPEDLVSATRFHNSPFDSSDGLIFPLLIHLSNAMAHFTESDREEESLRKLITPDIIKFFENYKRKWDINELQKLVKIFEAQKEESSEMLNLLFS